MENKKILIFAFLFAFFSLLIIHLVSAQVASPSVATFQGNSRGTGGEFSSSSGSFLSTNVQFTDTSFAGLGGVTGFNNLQPGEFREVCRERTDFIIQVAPAGCSPTVVRSDLLAEQNVPVFCKLQAIQINPTIDVDLKVVSQ